MAAAGTNYTTSFVSKSSPDAVVEAVLAGLAGASDTTVTMAGPSTVVVTRKYTPTWAVVVGIVGILLFLIGILAFFVKTTDTLTITISAAGKGSRVQVTGVTSPEIVARLNGLNATLQGKAAAPAVQPETAIAW
jgi:hypothetical protein